MGRAGSSIGMSRCSRVHRLLGEVLFGSLESSAAINQWSVTSVGGKDSGRNFVVSCFLTRSSRSLSGLITRLFGMALAGEVDVGVDKAMCSRYSF